LGGRATIPFDCAVLGGRAPKLLVIHDRAVAMVREFADKGKVVASHQHHCNTCATLDVLLKHPKETFATNI
jgi:putative intracellular protease/amidase